MRPAEAAWILLLGVVAGAYVAARADEIRQGPKRWLQYCEAIARQQQQHLHAEHVEVTR